MSAILPFIQIDSSSLLARYFTPYQIAWIEAEAPFHAAKKQVFALAEKSVRIGWTFADGFKNVQKRLRFKKRDYLFVTKDWPSALEYMNQVYQFADVLGFTRAVLNHGEDVLKVPHFDSAGHRTTLTEEVKIGYIKFQNGSRIIAFSSNPYAMAVYGGDVGLDEFAKHPNAELLWQTAQARVTWNCDLAVWSSHDGEDTLFNQFVQQARLLAAPLNGRVTVSAASAAGVSPANSSSPALRPDHRSCSEGGRPGEGGSSNNQPSSSSFHRSPDGARSPGAVIPSNSRPLLPLPPGEGRGEGNFPVSQPPTSVSQPSTLNSQPPSGPWNLYFRVTMPDAVELGLLDVINRTTDANFTAPQFLADCRARAGSEEIFQQSYMCNPLGASTAHIVEWSAIERCRYDYSIERLHLEADDVTRRFGQFNPSTDEARQRQIHDHIVASFPKLFKSSSGSDAPRVRLGFDVAASGRGDLAVIYIDEFKSEALWLKALFTCRTEDWQFITTVLYAFLDDVKNLQGAGDESGLGRQICWQAAADYSSRFMKVNFASKKQELGFTLMNQLSSAEKRFPRTEQDVAADYFALRKSHNGTRWVFSESANTFNPASHCDIAWAGALSTYAHNQRKSSAGAAVLYDTGWVDERGFHPYTYKT